jgi:hypothetical protein
MVETAEPVLLIRAVIILLWAAAVAADLPARLETAQLVEMVLLRLVTPAELAAAVAATAADLLAKTVQILRAAPGVITPADLAAARHHLIIPTLGLRAAAQAEA